VLKVNEVSASHFGTDFEGRRETVSKYKYIKCGGWILVSLYEITFAGIYVTYVTENQ
jgi:hypothetical protein